MVRTVFAHSVTLRVECQLKAVATLSRQHHNVAETSQEAARNHTALRYFSTTHWSKGWSTSSLESLHADVKGRTNVVRVFLNNGATLDFLTVIVAKQHDEWSVCERHHPSRGPCAL